MPTNSSASKEAAAKSRRLEETTPAAAGPHDMPRHRLSTRHAAGTGHSNLRQRRQPVVDLPPIDTRRVRHTNMGGSQSMPPSPTSAPIGGERQTFRHPSIVGVPQTADIAGSRQPFTPLFPVSSGGVQSGKMTKVPHYGRLRSVTARVLRMMDPRALAQQQQHQPKQEDIPLTAHEDGAAQGGTAAGVLGRSVVDTMRDAAAVRRRRRYSHGSIPTGLSRHGSREYNPFVANPPSSSARVSADLLGAFRLNDLSHSKSQEEGVSRHPSVGSTREAPHTGSSVQSALSRRPSAIAPEACLSPVLSAGSGSPADAENLPVDIPLPCTSASDSVIAIPMPGFFLDPASDDWVGGHSFAQRMRYPDEVITVPASLTKRVHYEVSYDYPKNAISTARYNVVTFLPAQLAAQFSKVANVYFLFIAALQQVPGWSTTGRWSTVLPLCIFISLSIAHEGFDDLRRHRMDHAENTQRTRVLKVKVHDRERLSFRFRDLRHRGSQSIHSFRMRSSQSFHDIGRNTLDGARRWAGSTLRVGSTVKESILSRMAEKRRKQREMEDSDDEDEHPGGANASGSASGVEDGGGDEEAGGVSEATLRRKLNRGVISLRSWRSNQHGNMRQSTAANLEGDDGSAIVDIGRDSGWDSANPQASVATSMNDLGTPLFASRQLTHQRQPSRLGATNTPSPEPPKRRGPMVAFNDVVEEMPVADDAEPPLNPLPENMSCRWKKKRWENVQVGDLLMISKDEWIPADCVVIASSGFDGTCFVETAALDGETTLKQKQALEATNSEIQTPEQLAAFNAFTYVEPPSAELYSFEGYMEIGGERYPLTPNQVLLRGSVLRNTAYVFAQVVYSGEQTRLRLNATRNVRTKAPQIQRITNRVVILVFLILLILCFVFSALGIHWNNTKRRGHWYLGRVHMPATALIFGYIVMMNSLIPISLYVTLEAVKIFQCWFIQQDVSMYHAETDTKAEAHTTAINEDLGMVRYVFSDKTGTLTENIMKLRAVMVAGFSYLHIDLDRLHTPTAGNDEEEQKGEAGEEEEEEDAEVESVRRGKHSRSGSALSFLRPGSPSPSSTGRQSPSLFRAQVFGHHKRQQSLPPLVQHPIAHAPGSRTLQQLAVTNRANTSGVTFPRHSRGLSASVLRSSAAASSQLDMARGSHHRRQKSSVAPLLNNASALPSDLVGPAPAVLGSDALQNDSSMDEYAIEEEASQDGTDADPDLIAPDGDDPRLHTTANEDAPTSDLLALPSSRTIMDSFAPPTEVFRSRAEWFLRCIALCHTVQPDRDPLTGRITGYQATSPDEKALVAAAAELGYVMNNRAGPLVQLRVVASERMRDFNSALIDGTPPSSGNAKQSLRNGRSASPGSSPEGASTTLHVGSSGSGEAVAAADGGEKEESFDRGVPAPDHTDRLGNYEVLDVLEFSSARKRMSVIYRCPDGRIIMMSKGADSAIWPRLLSTDRLESNPSDTSFKPKPAAAEGVPLRRTLSRPSAAYLHSRNSSMASSSNMESADIFGRTTGPSSLTPGIAYPARTASRLGDGSWFASGDGASNAGPGESHRLRMPLGLFDDFDGASDDSEDDGAKKMTAASTPQRGTPSHRRAVSDAQLSLLSEASSMVDAQGQLEVPNSFEAPTREEEEWARGRALEALHQFSTEGLRTLAYAHKDIPPHIYEAWHQRYVAATTALANRQKQIEAVCEEIEGDLLLTGISAIEDRLQAGVPETIFKLRRAGIRVWMLTGDKVETAINIAKSCRLIDTEVVEMTKLDPADLEESKDKMALLVLQSTTDYEALDKIISQALLAVQSMSMSVDERFERRSKMEKLMRGMKKFGNKLNPQRLVRRHGKDSRHRAAGDTAGPSVGDAGHGTLQPPLWQTSNTKPTDYLDLPIGQATEIGWADDTVPGTPRLPSELHTETPATLAVFDDEATDRDSDEAGTVPQSRSRRISQPMLSGSSRRERAVSAATTTVSQEQQRQRLLTSSSASSERASDATEANGGGVPENDPPMGSKDGALSGGKISDGASLAVVIDGETLAALEQYQPQGLLDKFLSLGTLCDAVICSRVSPSQKALVVHNMRVRCEGGTGEKKQKHWNPLVDLLTHNNDNYAVTLAIGDGGNDIAMIQEAHVGIGIAGQEGLQASRAADFSIGQFRFLQKLLLVHGRWSYVRVSMFIMGTFYKCMAFYTTQLIFQFYTGFSGTSVFETWTLSMYNTLFSILPVLVVGIFEQDLLPDTLLAYPELYRDMGPRNHLFTVPLFIRRVVVIGILHSIIAAYFPFATNLFLGREASSNDLYITGFVVYGIMVLIVTFKIAYVDVRRWVVFSHISVVLTLALWFGWNGVLNHVYHRSPADGYYVLGVFRALAKKGTFWFQWIIFVAVALCLNVLILIVYTIRDPVEHRIMSWVAFERKREHRRHRRERRAWLAAKGLWESRGRRREHSHIN